MNNEGSMAWTTEESTHQVTIDPISACNVEDLYNDGVINPIDCAMIDLIRRRMGEIDPTIGIIAALLSRAAASGDVCLDLKKITQNGYQHPESARRFSFSIHLEQLQKKLLNSPAVGLSHENKPLILDGDRLYLQRFWKYENAVARKIVMRCQTLPQDLSPFRKASAAFKGDKDQEKAIITALSSRFTVISGGPGTGKTYTIAKIIQILQSNLSNRQCRIKLAAPTGKAAARLQEALDQAFAVLQKQSSTVEPKAFRAQTIHRMLGAIPGSIRFRYNAQHTLPADVVIVDEASMIDLALMAKLIDAIPDSAKLILVGDKDQLASVEAGAVLGDICWGGESAGSVKTFSHLENGVSTHRNEELSDAVVVLRTSYRFDARSGINALASAINSGDGDRSLSLLLDDQYPDIRMKFFSSPQKREWAMEKLVMERLAPAFKMDDPKRVLDHFTTLKILTPLRKGPSGVETLNRWVEKILLKAGVINLNIGDNPEWYSGRPVMMTCNDYFYNLFNGDVGVAFNLEADVSDEIRVFFPDYSGNFKSLAPEQLPGHETVYAMTVHKSQGTEFENVLLILPELDLPLLTRELIYTAVTRARKSVEIWGSQDLLKKAISRRVQRASGLRHVLWSHRPVQTSFDGDTEAT